MSVTPGGSPAGTYSSGAVWVAHAREVAQIAHEGQRDKNGDPYIEHPARVAAAAARAGLGHDAQQVAWLHDVVEDDPSLGLDALRYAGFSDEVVAAVDAISHRDGETREDYYERVKANPLALQVKALDIADNTNPARLEKLDGPVRERLEKKYAKARHLLGIS